MRKLLMGVLACGTILAATPTILAQEAGADHAAAAQAAMMKHMMPGPEHAAMAERVGTWKMNMKMWMDPSAPPMETTGTATYTMTMGGRLLRGDHKSNMMGMEMHGVSVEAYDNTRQVYTMTWVDNLSTGMTYGEGTLKDNVMTMTGKMTEPTIGGQVDYKSVTKIESKDKAVMEMYVVAGGKDTKAFEIVYERMP